MNKQFDGITRYLGATWLHESPALTGIFNEEQLPDSSPSGINAAAAAAVACDKSSRHSADVRDTSSVSGNVRSHHTDLWEIESLITTSPEPGPAGKLAFLRRNLISRLLPPIHGEGREGRGWCLTLCHLVSMQFWMLKTDAGGADWYRSAW